ncbi:MAG: hypothetical protein KC620_18645, partial [Myxococcales bacterium]|nr:hypothetical protein [Myxococcales bacterium]
MHRWFVGALGLAVGLVSCAGGADSPAVVPMCGSLAACPRGQVCVADRCVRPGDPGEDASPPISLDAVTAVDAAVDAGADAGPDAMAGACREGETRSCGVSLGRCRRGLETCGPDGLYGACEGGTGPEAEGCNGADDDCDGQVDEDFNLGAPCEGVGACGAGVFECARAGAMRCDTDPGGTRSQVADEVCNGVDDDCDGALDEGHGVGEACMGQCGPGATECTPGGQLRCDTDAGGSASTPQAETCNGRDDDCDGTVDEGFDLGVGCLAIGACGPGVVECAEGGGTRCSTSPEGSDSRAVPERCNTLDDDCDGVTDEDLNLGAPCDGALPCGAGVLECGEGDRVLCSTDPGGSAERGVERCNARDDDCDGVIDEGLPLGDGCPARGACPPGLVVCSADETVVCSTQPGGPNDASTPERCNQVDDDCDGRTDEGFGVGDACRGRGACGDGVRECGPLGLPVCSTEPGGSADASQEEGCNQLDDDCDGIVDERGCGGDTCAAARGLAPFETALGSTTGLVDDYSRANCLGNARGPDMVFRFDVPGPGRWVIGVAPLDPAYDTAFWVAADCADPTSCLGDARQDREGAGRPEADALNMIRGGTFALIVDGRDEAQHGPFAVTVGPPDEGERCGNAIALTLPARFVGSTARRGQDVAGQQCPPGVATVGPDQVFRFRLDA